MTRDWLDILFPPNAERTVPWPVVGEIETLWRPTGLHELRLVAASGWRAWPPRLPDQPIFYPVLNRPYAEEIARDWNAKRNDPPVGFVTELDVRSDAAIVGPIRVVAHFAGEGFMGRIDPVTHLPED